MREVVVSNTTAKSSCLSFLGGDWSETSAARLFPADNGWSAADARDVGDAAGFGANGR